MRDAARLLVDQHEDDERQEVADVRTPDAQRERGHEQDQEVAIRRQEHALDEDHRTEAGEVAEHERRHAPPRPDPTLASSVHRWSV